MIGVMVVYVIYLLLSGTAIGIIAVWKYSAWVIKQYKIMTSFNHTANLKVEHVHYDHEDYYAEMRYMPKSVFDKVAAVDYRYDPRQEIIDGNDHKKHMINKMAYSLITKMVDDGIVDVMDIRDETHTFMKLLQIKIRVYKKRQSKI